MRKPRKILVWYRYLRRRTRGLRRFCISLFSVMVFVSKVVEKTLDLLSGSGLI